MKISDILPLIHSFWDALALPLLYAIVATLAITWATPDLAVGLSIGSHYFVDLWKEPELVDALKTIGLLEVLPLISLIATNAMVLSLEQLLYLLGDAVPININSRDPARFIHTSRSRLAYFIERLPQLETPSLLQEYLVALAAPMGAELKSQEAQWRRKAENYGRHLRVAKAALLLLFVGQLYLLSISGVASLNLRRLVLMAALLLLAALFFAVRLVTAYEQIGFAESTLCFQALMLSHTGPIETSAREEAARRSAEWQEKSSYQGWWRIRLGYGETFRWIRRVLRERAG
jgi:hypothetical protein